jgi:hypothetical protein
MAKSLNLKIKKAKLITTLEAKLKELEANYKNNDKKQAQHDKEMEAYNAAILKLVKSGKATLESADENRYYGSRRKTTKEFSVTVSIPKSLVPQQPEQPETYEDYRWRQDKEAITNALRMLELSDDEYVSASTIRSVSDYL